MEGLRDKVLDLLDEIQANLFNKALNYRTEHTTEVNSWDEFKEVLENKGGFIMAHWDGTNETEDKIKEETKATIRSIPLDYENAEEGVCVYSGKPSKGRVVFAKAY
jgi:prolyl-tRNA synthetase